MATNQKQSAEVDRRPPGAMVDPFSADFRPFSRPAQPRRVCCGALEVDGIEHRAVVAGSALPLTERELDLLLYLANRENRAVRRSEILAEIWGEDRDDGSNVVAVYIRRLRQKLGGHAGIIQTVRGFGYRLRAPLAA